MTKDKLSLANIYEGWDGQNTSLVHAIAPLTHDALLWRPSANLNSVGELARHISMARITWFTRMSAPGSATLADQIPSWEQDSDGNYDIAEGDIDISTQATELVHWLEVTWQMIETTLQTWDTSDLVKTYRHTWNGKVYAVSRQWTIWRILTHDVHHGGQISLMLGMQGIEAFELGDLFGHIIMPALADPS